MGTQRSGVVTAYLVDTGTQWSRAVPLTHDGVLVAGKTTLEVRANRCDEDQEQVVLGRMNANLRADADEQRADIQRSTTLISRYPLLIEAHHLLHHFLKHLCRHLWHHDAVAGTLQACGVVFHTEDTHLAVGTTVSLQSFKGLLTIVKAGGSHVHVDVFVGTHLNLAPFAVTIITPHIVVGLTVTEGQILPI